MISENIKQLIIPNHVTVLAATKSQSISKIQEAIDSGINVIGENYVQEAETKYPYLDNVEKHLIGNLQSNKVNKALEIFDCIQTLDSLRLAKKISLRSIEPYPVYIQVNIGKDPHKKGILPEQITDFLKDIATLDLELKGFMTITPLTSDPNDAKSYFAELRSLLLHSRSFIPKLGMGLSMGMSKDYTIAIEEGATLVRLGSKIFGARN